MFNESLWDTEIFWISFGDFITVSAISTVIISEIGFTIWLLLKWFHKNVKINWSPVFKIEGSSIGYNEDSSIKSQENSKKNVNMGPVEVNIDKNIFIDKTDEQNVKVDEKIKGKVKTQKNKLKKLRGK